MLFFREPLFETIKDLPSAIIISVVILLPLIALLIIRRATRERTIRERMEVHHEQDIDGKVRDRMKNKEELSRENQRIISNAKASMAVEGFEVTEKESELVQQYLDGSLSEAEVLKRIKGGL